ncbi:MAG: pyridoxal-phosphate dependent enzyme [Nitrososphaerales archaeon]|nr:pyridoxal-phosphate dependent enzyme [Nitrososphaerales archaeon]
MASFRCVGCSATTESNSLDPVCGSCGSALVALSSETPRLGREILEGLPPGVWRYRAFIPSIREENIVTLGEGGTPLLPATRLGRELGLRHLLIKDETRNPTGSFIDRGSTVLASLAKEIGVTSCSCVTTGNLGASLAAYCAKAGISAVVRIHPNTDRGKLYQMIAFGAQVKADSKPATGDESGGRLLSVTAGNPYLLEGEKTTCFEIIQDLGWKTPDAILVPVGTGGHLSMFWRAIQQMKEAGLIDRSKCRLIGVQLSVSAPIEGFRHQRLHRPPSEELFTELNESEPIFRSEAVRAMRESGGRGLEATASETISATGLLARTEGIFAEPAAASVVACLETAVSNGVIEADEVVVGVITGAGLKDTRAISRIAKAARQVGVRDDYTLARMRVGETKMELMRSLSAGPRFGYEMWKGLSAARKITTASVYQHLGELEGLTLVRKSGVSTAKGRERVFYELTGKGSDFLRMAGKIERS